ncbi:uncharacterized protein [Malus domestica]|uniref:uncharacterized protein n=1 Tax=Malus domestica TaxID=3750 RepID=UPI00397714F0
MKALIALKKGSQLIKYSWKGKPKLHPFQNFYYLHDSPLSPHHCRRDHRRHITAVENTRSLFDFRHTIIDYKFSDPKHFDRVSRKDIFPKSQWYVANEGKNNMQFAAYRKRRLIWFSLNESKIIGLEPVVSKKGLYLPFTSQLHNTKVQEKQRFEIKL